MQSLVYDYILLMDMAHSEYFNEDLRKHLFEHLSRGLDLIDFDTWEGVDEAAAYIQKNIYDNHDFRGSGSVALVGHSHLDIAYYWRRIHAVQKNARTVLIQLRLMDRYPEFRYTHTQAYTYETLEKYYPELLEELKQRVAEGSLSRSAPCMWSRTATFPRQRASYGSFCTDSIFSAAPSAKQWIMPGFLMCSETAGSCRRY